MHHSYKDEDSKKHDKEGDKEDDKEDDKKMTYLDRMQCSISKTVGRGGRDGGQVNAGLLVVAPAP